MILSWLFCRIPGLANCLGTPPLLHRHDGAGPPPSEARCWETLTDIYSESQYRYSLGQGSTLHDQKNRAEEAIYTLVRHHGRGLESIHQEMRQRRLSLIWLYALPHPGTLDPECATVCRDAVTREARTHSVGIFLGPESEYILVRQATRGSCSLDECGFLEVR